MRTLKGINMFTDEKVNVHILGIIKTHICWFIKLNCPKTNNIFLGRMVEKTFKKRNLMCLYWVRFHLFDIREGGDGGEPVTVNEDSITSLAFRIFCKSAGKVKFHDREQQQPKVNLTEMTFWFLVSIWYSIK